MILNTNAAQHLVDLFATNWSHVFVQVDPRWHADRMNRLLHIHISGMRKDRRYLGHCWIAGQCKWRGEIVNAILHQGENKLSWLRLARKMFSSSCLCVCYFSRALELLVPSSFSPMIAIVRRKSGKDSSVSSHSTRYHSDMRLVKTSS